MLIHSDQVKLDAAFLTPVLPIDLELHSLGGPQWMRKPLNDVLVIAENLRVPTKQHVFVHPKARESSESATTSERLRANSMGIIGETIIHS